jgi:hypothetical protein
MDTGRGKLETTVGLMDVVRIVIQWGVVPLVGFVFLIYRGQQNHQTEIAVMKAVQLANKEAHDREFKEMRKSFDQVFTKLDTIEQALRK